MELLGRFSNKRSATVAGLANSARIEFLRRFISSSLLFLFSLTLLAPLLAAFPATAEENLPACCRRDGKHGCAKRATPADLPGAALLNATPHCGQYPSAPSSAAGHAGAAVVAQSAVSLSVVSALAPWHSIGWRDQSAPAAHLRGPPAPLA